MIEPDKPFFLQALDALKEGDRREAAVLLGRQLREGNTSPKNLPSVFRLATHIGEIELALEASRQAVVPGVLPSLLDYCGNLAAYGRGDEALAEIERKPQSVLEQPSVLHILGSIASQLGRFQQAEDLFRQALAKAPDMPATWLSLAMIKDQPFTDRDIDAMRKLERGLSAGVAPTLAPLLYALGKAYEERGDVDRAFAYYARGAELRKRQSSFDVQEYLQAADKVSSDFSADAVARLAPSNFARSPSLMVTGLPRSGTTLTEQLLVAHSEVEDGAEISLFPPATLPLLGMGIDNALAYEKRAESADPWGEIAIDYREFLRTRFRTDGLVIDKSLGEAPFMGIRLHAIPDARIAWVRRRPDDVALSCFRTFFATGLNWTCSLTDIADYMRAEDRLMEHWCSVFGSRILVVPYEEMVAEPAAWSTRLQEHFRLTVEEGLENRPRGERAVTTASVAQVRQPISTARIGQASAFEKHLEPFRERYYG